MSLLCPSELCVVVYPEQLVLLNAACKLTPRGLKRHIHAQATIPCGAATGADAPWSGALRRLETALPLFAPRKTKVTVILSNHFVHYVLVPWAANLYGEKEELAYARHCMAEVYGDAVEAWDVRFSPDKAGAPALASAVDRKLLEELRDLLERAGVVVKSIQPHMMAAHNTCHASLSGRNAWLALLEPGNLCLSMLQQGRWTWMRKMRIGHDWQEELLAILEREECLAGADAAVNEVLLWAPHLHDSNMAGQRQIQAGKKWKFEHLRASPKYGFVMDEELSGVAAVA